ncbi:MAG: hypothetical protein LUQ56_07120, partial [Methylococcaceae bacterium]|nr:hypothetical protein [Methylococcaceae bacterium]
ARHALRVRDKTYLDSYNLFQTHAIIPIFLVRVLRFTCFQDEQFTGVTDFDVFIVFSLKLAVR